MLQTTNKRFLAQKQSHSDRLNKSIACERYIKYKKPERLK